MHKAGHLGERKAGLGTWVLKVAIPLVERVKRNHRVRLVLGGETLKDAVKTEFEMCEEVGRSLQEFNQRTIVISAGVRAPGMHRNAGAQRGHSDLACHSHSEGQGST